MLLELVNFLAAYLFISLAFRVIVMIIPGPLRSGFETIGDLRLKFTQTILSLYRTDTNVEVIVLAIIFAPFTIMMLIFSTLQVIVINNPEMTYINVWIILLLIFIINFLAPTPEEVQVLRSVNPASIFVMTFKILLVLELVVNYPAFEIVGLGLLIIPISPLLKI